MITPLNMSANTTIIITANTNNPATISCQKCRIKLLAILLIVILMIECAVSGHQHRSQHHHRNSQQQHSHNNRRYYRQLESASQTKCLEQCSCKWRSGKMTVECFTAGFHTIPNGLNSDTQVLHLTGNAIQVLRARSFQLAELTHLQRIYLNRCGLVSLDDDAFYQVSNLVELDLSSNFLTAVPHKALAHCPLIRKLNFAHNPIRVLENNTFSTLSHLQTIDLSNANIGSIDANAFQGLKSLKQLYLNGNKLSYLSGNCVHSLPSLYELLLHNNPWNCDCRLKDLRDWMLQHKIPLSYSPNCSTPARLAGHDWNSLQLDDFACAPSIVSVGKNVVVYEGENASLDCVISAIPAVKVEWEWKGRAITNMSLMTFGRQMYLIREGANGPLQRSSTLYIMNAFAKDAGSYTCIGANKAGNVSSNVTLTVIQRRAVSSSYSGEEVAGMVLGTMFIFLLIFVGICVVVLRSKTHYEDIGVVNINQVNDTTNLVNDRKSLTVAMNHNSYQTTITSNDNHLAMTTLIPTGNNKNSNNNNNNNQNSNNKLGVDNVDHQHSIESDVKCFSSSASAGDIIDVIRSQRIIEDNGCCDDDSDEQQFVRHQSSATQQFAVKSDDELSDYNETPSGDYSVSNYVPTPTTSSKHMPTMPLQTTRADLLLRRRTSDITDELNHRFEQQKLLQSVNNAKPDHHSVRFSNNATIYNYQPRIGQSMESLDSDSHRLSSNSNGYNNAAKSVHQFNNRLPNNHEYFDSNSNHNNYNNHPNGQLSSSANNNRSLAGFSYTLRPGRLPGKQWRRSGGSLAALLAIDARDSPDEGLGDEREYETDILE